MKHVTISFLLLLMVSCNTNQTKNDNTNTSTLFEEYIKTLPKVILPLSLSCGIDNAKDIEQTENFKRFIPWHAERVLGSLPTNGKYNLIMYGYIGDDTYPILFSYDNEGKIIDSLDLIINSCGGADESRIPYSSAEISKDLTIILTDTTKLIHYPIGSKSVEDYIIDSIRITRIINSVDSKGHFVVKMN